MAVGDAEADLAEFAFGQVATDDRTVRGLKPRIAVGQRAHRPQERLARRSDQVAEDEVGSAGLDVGDQPLDLRLLDGKAALADDAAARLGHDLAREAVHLPAPDIVGAGQIDPRAVARQQVVEQGHEMLVGAGPV